MLITRYNELSKYRSKVQCAFEYGAKWSGFSAHKEISTPSMDETSNIPNEITDFNHTANKESTENTNMIHEFVECWAGNMCGLAQSQSKMIRKYGI